MRICTAKWRTCKLAPHWPWQMGKAAMVSGWRSKASPLMPLIFQKTPFKKARLLAERRMQSVQWHCSDWQSFNWKASHYTNVVGIFFQFAAPLERKTLFAKMDASLKSGGTLIIQGYTAAQLQFNTGGPGKLAHMYDEPLMRDAFANYDIIDLQTYEAQIVEGTAHKGMSGLLGLTARKR